MKKLLLLLFFTFPTFLLWAQTQDKVKLEQERQAIQKEIKEIQGVYNTVKGKTKETLGQLNLLQKKLALQDQYIGNINKEIKYINNDIYSSTLELNNLKHQLDTLKMEYSRSVVYAYKNRSAYDYLNFIFSANTFNDALRRISYLKSYRAYREQQVKTIRETQSLIEVRRQQLLGKQTNKKAALQNQTKQMEVLEDQKKEKDGIISKLKSKESELSKQITVKKKRDIQLKNNIAIIIKREIEARRKAEAADIARRKEAEALARKNNPPATTNTTTTTPSTTKAPVKKTVVSSIPLNEKEEALSSSFSSNKGKLPWPVDNGYVSIHYGTYSIPGTKITDVNPGITISTPSVGTPVKAVFDGEVLGVFNLGDGMAVTISHGKYFTTYSNLSGVSVGKGTMVRTGQTIGRAAGDDDGGDGGKIDFLLFIEQTNVNPEPWLRGK
ncbi:MAG: peptidoglycan DD-metalloendopeptidase family protein [Chitinophagaceae bacterium]